MEYQAKYKCRYCGEVFTAKFKTSVRHNVKHKLINPDIEIHYADDYPENPHIGVADLIGVAIKGTEDDREDQSESI